MVLTGASAGMTTGAAVLVRVRLPDRPGALGAVASRIGAVRGDILGIDVLEQSDDGVAVDEFGVLLPDAGVLPLLIREVEEVDGARVEEALVVDHFPDPRLDALSAAVVLCEAPDPPALVGTLVTYVGGALLADWAAIVDGDRVTERWAQPPPDRQVVQLAAGALQGGAGAGAGRLAPAPDHVAVAVLSIPRLVVLAGRAGNVFRARERAQLAALARVADRLWAMLGATPTVSPV